MKNLLYNEDYILDNPGTAHFYEHLQGLRDELDRMESQRDAAIELLVEASEAEDDDEISDVMVRVKEFVDGVGSEYVEKLYQ